MKHFNRIVFLISSISFVNITIANDCNTAINITPATLAVNSQQAGTLASATWSGGLQCAGPGASPDMWYQFTATATRMFVAAQGGGDLNIAIEVFSDCVGTSVFCRNNTGAGALEIANVNNLVVGNTYYFSVFHAGGTPQTTDAYEVAVFYIPIVELRSQDCDIFNYNTNQIIRSNQPASSEFTTANFQFRFVELEAPFNTYEVISPNGTNPNYRLEWFGPIQYGRTYELSVRIRVSEGSYFGDYGSACTIGLQPTVLTTRLQQQYSNGVFNFCSILGADKVGGASQYRWVFNDLETPVSVFGDGDSRLLKLQNVPDLQLAQTYIVSVFATVNGDESPAGTLRFISTVNSVPPTGLNQSLHPCGNSYPINLSVQAIEVCSADSYTWRFTNTSQAQAPLTYTRTDGNRALKLDFVAGLIVGDNYNVEVRANQGGLIGSFSSVCNITIGASTAGSPPMAPGGLTSLYEQNAYQSIAGPNGFSAEVSVQARQGEVAVTFSGDAETSFLTLELYNLSGQLISTKMVAATNGEQFIWNTGSSAKGIYLVRITDGTRQLVKKVSFL